MLIFGEFWFQFYISFFFSNSYLLLSLSLKKYHATLTSRQHLFGIRHHFQVNHFTKTVVIQNIEGENLREKTTGKEEGKKTRSLWDHVEIDQHFFRLTSLVLLKMVKQLLLNPTCWLSNEKLLFRQMMIKYDQMAFEGPHPTDMDSTIQS